MNPSFARIVSSWIPPEAVLAAARRYSTDRAGALADGGLRAGLQELPFRHRMALMKPVLEWLAEPLVHPEVLAMLRRFAVQHAWAPDSSESAITEEAWDWLASLRLSANDVMYDPENTETTTLWILAPRAVCDLIRTALFGLVRTVGWYVGTWNGWTREAAAAGAKPDLLFFVPAQAGWFSTQIEAWVAEEFATPRSVRVALRPTREGVHRHPGYVAALIPTFPLTAGSIDALREIAAQPLWSPRGPV
jgi:hypothetical protein